MDIRVDDAVVVDQPKLPRTATIVIVGLRPSEGVGESGVCLLGKLDLASEHDSVFVGLKIKRTRLAEAQGNAVLEIALYVGEQEMVALLVLGVEE